jgi:hypothetical protein
MPLSFEARIGDVLEVSDSLLTVILSSSGAVAEASFCAATEDSTSAGGISQLAPKTARDVSSR